MPPSDVGPSGDGHNGSNGNGQDQGPGEGRRPSAVPDSEGNNGVEQPLEQSDDENDGTFAYPSNAGSASEAKDEVDYAQEASSNAENESPTQTIEQLKTQNTALRNANKKYEDQCKEAMRKVSILTKQIVRLQESLDRKRVSVPPQPWQEKLQPLVGEGSGSLWDEVYRDCCKQENMSMNLTITHPDIEIVERDIPRRLLEAAYRPPGGNRFMIFDILTRNRRNLVFATIILPLIFTRARPLHLIEVRPFPFERLPNSIQARIFKLVFVKQTLVHCLSRLDKSKPPPRFDYDERRTGLLHRFHIGTNECCVAIALKPYNVLRPLMVSKRWLFIGVHVFYGMNTFAFSSLGEMGRFFNGIGPARVERIQHVELMWHGNLMHPGAQLIEPTNDAGRPIVGKKRLHKVSKRTRPLMWFTQARRLRTLLVHISESDRSQVRRGYEMKDDADWDEDEKYDKTSVHRLDPFGQMVKRTACQPNFRKFRSMRTTHGMDYVYQLRGMEWVRFKDVSALTPRTDIRDWSFLNDVNSVCTQPKPYKDGRESELYRLKTLSGLRGWKLSEEDLEMIKGFYDEGPVEGLVSGSATSGSVLGSSSNARSGSTDASDTDEDDDVDDSDTEGGGNGGGGNNGGGAATPMVIDSDGHSDSGSTGHGRSAGLQSDPIILAEEDDSAEADAGDDGPMAIDAMQSNTSDESLSSHNSSGDVDDDESTEGVHDTQNTTIPPSSGNVIDLTSDDEEDVQQNNNKNNNNISKGKGKAPDDDDDDAKTSTSTSTSTSGIKTSSAESTRETEEKVEEEESLFVPPARSEDGRTLSHIAHHINRNRGTDTSMGPPPGRAPRASTREIKDESSSSDAYRRHRIVDLTGDDDESRVKQEMPPPSSFSVAAGSRKRTHGGGDLGGSAPKRSRPNRNLSPSPSRSASPGGFLGALRKGPIYPGQYRQDTSSESVRSESVSESDGGRK